jgi:hypothetical protein
VCRFPFRHARRDLGVILGQLPELPEHILLGRSRRLGDERRGTEQLARWVAPTFYLKDPAHLTVVGHGKRHQHDHSSRQHASEREEMWTHRYKLRVTRTQRKPIRR